MCKIPGGSSKQETDISNDTGTCSSSLGLENGTKKPQFSIMLKPHLVNLGADHFKVNLSQLINIQQENQVHVCCK